VDKKGERRDDKGDLDVVRDSYQWKDHPESYGKGA